ncbi:hypothetical protein HaLaN_10371 [Haematococcus lacustris]|uniref:Uncharacterized protein n=1 Tax=Haematococcus lacustris TaxID=44745 RepID=A0A699YXF8_HAELA|nr:hypothetical protein HaLaN_10371 [Haematococcus lacustris]
MRWLAQIQPHIKHLTAANSAGNCLQANLQHINVTLATWEAVWEVCPDPNWRMAEMAEVCVTRHERVKQLVVFIGSAGIHLVL